MARKKDIANNNTNIVDVVNQFCNTSEIDWCGVHIVIKKVVPFEDYVNCIEYVFNSCCTYDTMTYRPEVKDFAIRSTIVGTFTDIVLPDDVYDMYRFLYETDIYDTVCLEINNSQLESIINSCNNKINMFVEERVSSSAKMMNDMVKNLEEFTSKFSALFDGVSYDDLSNITNALSEGNIEDMILSAYNKMNGGGGQIDD